MRMLHNLSKKNGKETHLEQLCNLFQTFTMETMEMNRDGNDLRWSGEAKTYWTLNSIAEVKSLQVHFP